MKRTFLSRAAILSSMLIVVSALSAQESPATPAAGNTSKVRIVRISQVGGTVEIDRHINRGFEPAITNLPVTEQNQVRTGFGLAEVEFEDNSSLRIGPDSLVEFPRLERESSGATVSTVHLVKGTVYVSLLKLPKGKIPENRFELVFGSRTLSLDPATHVRLDLAGSEAKLAVLDGTVHLQGENGTVEVPRKKTATFQVFDKNEPLVAKNVVSSPLDSWDHDAVSYHARVASFGAFQSPYAYGLNDMMYYGSFSNVGGCGSMWRPYFASAAWDPYANGVWAWYPSTGYSWVSPYPWAWTPYHYGSWSFCPGAGWGWMPGGNWYGINNVAAVTTTGGGSIARTPVRGPHLPVRTPLPHQPAMFAVNSKPLTRSEVASPTSFIFRKDSAGLGIPRNTLGRLDGFSRQAVSRGTATMPIYASLPQVRPGGGSTSMHESIGASIHRGYAPSSIAAPSHSSYSSSSGYGGGSVSSGGSIRSAPAPVSTPSAPSSVHK